jgi:prepilin-type N-terminal cleavage/methylation domain-containing protein
MPTSSVGTTNRRRRGVTLIEMMVVVAIMALIAGLSFPAVVSGIESMRLSQATRSVVQFLNAGLNRAERRQTVVEVTISKADNALWLRSTEAGFEKKLDLPEGVRIVNVLPNLSGIPGVDTDAPRTFAIFPGGTTPRFGVHLANRRGTERLVSVDPITGVPRIEVPPKGTE